MSVITLTTDLGLKDFYTGAVKGAIYTEFPEAKIVDICHQIDAFNISQAAFIIKNAYLSFPKNSVHIIGVNTDLDPDFPFIAVYCNNHYFIGKDNGMFSIILDHKPDKMVTLDNILTDKSSINFPTKDVFVKAACHLVRGGAIEALGKKIDNFHESKWLQPVIQDTVIRGMVIYVDGYGNIITNITNEIFKNASKGRKFKIQIGRDDYISKIYERYNQVQPGECLCLFSLSGYLEIAINRGNASLLLGLKTDDIIRIEFQ